MLGLGFVRSGIRRLGESLHALADTLTEANGSLRSRMLLDGEDDLPPVVGARHAGVLPAVASEDADGETNGETTPVTGGKRKGKG